MRKKARKKPDAKMTLRFHRAYEIAILLVGVAESDPLGWMLVREAWLKISLERSSFFAEVNRKKAAAKRKKRR